MGPERTGDGWGTEGVCVRRGRGPQSKSVRGEQEATEGEGQAREPQGAELVTPEYASLAGGLLQADYF